MHLNAFVLAAQLVNFLLLLVLLKRFLFDRVAAAMDARAAAIAAEHARAQALQAQADAAAVAAAAQRAAQVQERNALLQQTRDEAERERQALRQQARDEAAAERRAWQQALRQEQADFIRAFRSRAARQVCDAAGRALADLADRDTDALIAGAFLRRLASPAPELRTALAAGGPVVMRSAFPFPESLRAECARIWTELLGQPADLRYETVPELVAGLEARCAGHTVAWNADRYLDTLVAELEAAFRDKAATA